MIPTKTELLKVAAHMLLTDIVEHPLFRSFQNRAEGLGRIVMHIAPGVLVPSVVDRFMGRISFADALVAMQLIGHQMRGLINESGDHRAQAGDAVVSDRNSPDRAASFNGYQHSLLLGAFAAFMRDAVLKPRLATDVFFIQFHDARKRREQTGVGGHHQADGVTELPGTFLRNTNPSGQKHRGDAFA